MLVLDPGYITLWPSLLLSLVAHNIDLWLFFRYSLHLLCVRWTRLTQSATRCHLPRVTMIGTCGLPKVVTLIVLYELRPRSYLTRWH